LALAEGGMISKNRQTIIVDAFSPKNPAIIMSDMANQLYRKSLILVLETLPFFHISNIGHIHSPVLLFAQSGKLLNSNPSYENDPFFTFISGIYNVIGAKHIMDSGEIKSEFTLVRNQKALLKENNKNQKEESA
jgi:acyl-CoA synthetase (NDP forming)